MRGMAALQSTALNDALPRCTYCGGVIGVYEPATQVTGESRLTTSRAAQPDLVSGSAMVYHAVCYELTRDARG